ncbi:geranylgeranyl reductase family protein [Halobacteroides halobius DSM 5150]|uniref:Geranylgeranyl reductase family protein n=1 Tax=Halobacteroides halobius (strain ATCC 35273 / DSM 5150 / MD-1) TaxID=748449 RepID=L0KAJ7_HALHC|nr:NAD(P)/FAD-dependent oxidoreductase [Halobacteroides halobius]AGB41384.1 geranylgeranyl reductase family protein [Halobacteroides halobius DSM 5150]
MVFDVIVVGAGPAGAYTSYNLAKENLNVLLIEEESLPRYKSCGGAISLKAKKYLADIDLTNIIEDKITNITFDYNLQPAIEIDFSKPFVYLVMRDKFDNLLVNKAKEAGAKVISNSKVLSITKNDRLEVTTKDNLFKSNYLIGADGVNSLIAKELGLKTNMNHAIGFEKEIKVSTPQLANQRSRIKLDYGAIPKGYGWIFPKQDHLSVGIASYKQGLNLKEKLTNYLNKEKIFIQEELNAKGHLLPVWQSEKTLNTNQGLLVGDAARLVDPLSGEGIFYALKSGQLASKAIIDNLEKNKSLNHYTTLVNQEIILEFKKAKLLSQFFFLAPKQIHKFLTSNQWLLEEFLKVIYGLKNYDELYNYFISEISFLKHITNK